MIVDVCLCVLTLFHPRSYFSTLWNNILMSNSVNVFNICRRVHEKLRVKAAQVEADGQDSVSLLNLQ